MMWILSNKTHVKIFQVEFGLRIRLWDSSHSVALPPISRLSWAHMGTRSSPHPPSPRRSGLQCWPGGCPGLRRHHLSPSWTPGHWQGCSYRGDREMRRRALCRDYWCLKGGSGPPPGSAECSCWPREPWKSLDWGNDTGRGSPEVQGWTWRGGRWRRSGCLCTKSPPAAPALGLPAPMSPSEAWKQERSLVFTSSQETSNDNISFCDKIFCGMVLVWKSCACGTGYIFDLQRQNMFLLFACICSAVCIFGKILEPLI